MPCFETRSACSLKVALKMGVAEREREDFVGSTS